MSAPELHRRKYEDVPCPRCGAPAGEQCHALTPPHWPRVQVHEARKEASRD